MFERIWIEPPLAIARVGSFPVLCEKFHWAANDPSPDGSSRTGLAPAVTLPAAADGSVSASLPAEVLLRNADGIRPVRPSLKLWGRGAGTTARSARPR